MEAEWHMRHDVAGRCNKNNAFSLYLVSLYLMRKNTQLNE